MEFTRRINALLKKEIKSLSKNWNILLMCLLPVLFSFIYTNVFRGGGTSDGIGKYEILYICLGMNIVLIAGFMIAMLIAEEKEKNTLRTLMLSGVSPLEFLIGKVVITFVVSEILNILIFYIARMDSVYLGKFILLTSLVAISMIEIGAVVGIIVTNQMSAGTVGMPIFMFFLMVPIFSSFSKKIELIANFLPNYNMNLMFTMLFSGGEIGVGEAKNIAVILIWIIIAGVTFVCTYNKVGLDKWRNIR
ncbi:ABC transporter permease [Clostridium estertheticum]|uniref:ABC transporter permease n=1 Tax=Clostridium estertheticum TaxID=238834 RepID=UPI001C0E618C|nr:ABC transporter permease [Clostridium estertheticum]MBU3201842.1 ABC transporter permease [Clostridium estertheticum]WAG67783.1 ABC transporter permease [Clostridium estertheticum]